MCCILESKVKAVDEYFNKKSVYNQLKIKFLLRGNLQNIPSSSSLLDTFSGSVSIRNEHLNHEFFFVLSEAMRLISDIKNDHFEPINFIQVSENQQKLDLVNSNEI